MARDLRTLTQQSLRNKSALVDADTFLFHDTIYNNIRFGRLDATQEEVYAAAANGLRARFHPGTQPQGYETCRSATKDACFPAGSSSAFAIARALLKNAPILLLDEATSALDSESEKQIQLALRDARRRQDRSSPIAHRLSTILSSDQIVVMDRGHIKEIGTHAELLAEIRLLSPSLRSAIQSRRRT